MEKDKGRILIVDDEVYIQEVLKATLEDAGYGCVSVGTAEDALAALASQHFDLAFADIRMPGKSGTELLADIHNVYPDVVVIMVTAVDSAATAIDTIRAGAYDYIIKPFNLDHILISANRALDKRRLERANRDYQRHLEQMAEDRAAETRRLFYSMTQVLVRLVDLKIPFNSGHAVRVAELSRHLARELRMTDDGVRKVYLAALLHDVGMITAKDLFLTKAGALTAEERQHIREHSMMAEDVLRPILDDDEVLKNIRHHRERFDGTGYPDGLKGQLIPLGARVIAVAEAFDAMTRNRPYRLALGTEQAMAELRRCASTQFDLQVVTVFQDVYGRSFGDLSQQFAP
jgi:response regulator RpfG family c-di-GMP phosphodiesterase